jgi:hypothetical protein
MEQDKSTKLGVKDKKSKLFQSLFFSFGQPLTSLGPLQSLRRGNHARCGCSEVIRKKEKDDCNKGHTLLIRTCSKRAFEAAGNRG